MGVVGDISLATAAVKCDSFGNFKYFATTFR